MCLCPFHFFHKYIPIYFSINSFRCMNNEHKDHKISLPNFDFERTSYISEINLEKDIDESRYAGFEHKDNGTSIAYEARVQASSAEAQKGKTKDALEDKRRGQETVRCRIPRGGKIPGMGSQHSPDPQKRW